MRHRLGLATRTQISVCKSPFPSAGTAVSWSVRKRFSRDCGLIKSNDIGSHRPLNVVIVIIVINAILIIKNHHAFTFTESVRYIIAEVPSSAKKSDTPVSDTHTCITKVQN